MFSGKRTDRIRLPRQLGFPSELGIRIRALAEIHRRSIEQQILHLVEKGIRQEEMANEDHRTSLHTAAHGGTR